ncbi:glycerol-3-phosphate acyltransferase [Ornithinibacillus contaminans]|uniref:glycerol-3-phosphate acyltransferase n=1 Tax=Ornithinibacillus contaminans TaxID=694055 RepID=UPI00064D9568|nr:glycerol-3-phosphate acyltransferase [Ornithinibacillus contaminans]
MYSVISLFIGYLIGCIHGSQLIGNYKKIDIKNTGVKNAGASNTTILLGWKYGIIVAIIDIFKGTFAVLLVQYIVGLADIAREDQIIFAYLTGLAVILGHDYPVTMKFGGGKGTASLIGIVLAIDWKLALISILMLIVFTLLTDYLVIGVLAMYLAVFLLTFYLFGLVPSLIVLILFMLSIMKHMENYKRIIKKEERKLSSMFQKN